MKGVISQNLIKKSVTLITSKYYFFSYDLIQIYIFYFHNFIFYFLIQSRKLK